MTDSLSRSDTDAANADAVGRMLATSPIVIDVLPAGQCIPGYAPNLILTSGVPMAWEQNFGGQRAALIGGALYEGLAASPAEAVAKFEGGECI